MARAAGQASRRPRTPSMMSSRMNGTSRSVSVPAVVMGMATAPKATGAVLASSTTVAVLSGVRPSARIIVAVMATGAPNPASASSRPPKQKAMRMAWMRRSPPPMVSNMVRMSSKRPESTVTW